MKNPNKYFKTLKFTFSEIDTIDERLNAASKMIEEHGGVVVGLASPVTFGVKPTHLIYTLIYTAKSEINANGSNAEENVNGEVDNAARE